MKRIVCFLHAILLFVCLVSLTGCPHDVSTETRTRLHRTNAIGIVGEASSEPYIEIRYSKADPTAVGVNKTEKLLVSPPYVFQNDNVYMEYEYSTVDDYYYETLIHDYGERGAEYLRIINHSPDKTVEVFFAGTQRALPDKASWPEEWPDRLASVRYKGTPIYYLLYPERANGTQWGEIPLTKAWTAEEVAALYRAEYEHAANINLVVDFDEWRMIDLVDGIDQIREYKGKFFYGKINPGETLSGNSKLWILATPCMFTEEMIFY